LSVSDAEKNLQGSSLNFSEYGVNMIRQLNVEEYKILRPLYQKRLNLTGDSIINGTAPAWPFVDQKSDQQSGLIWNKAEK